MDLLMDFVDNRSGASQILPSSLPSVSEFSSSSVPIVRPESNMQSSQANPGRMSEPVDILSFTTMKNFELSILQRVFKMAWGFETVLSGLFC
ncbi:hypothetical protein WN944_027829 [Citrus x changshan-huyou]|uniref:Uncharacterized protein n=1 Tax=Citrus x changshan-huyou TaxID=2935761 RepID=A0AAP0QA83_9ROSI